MRKATFTESRPYATKWHENQSYQGGSNDINPNDGDVLTGLPDDDGTGDDSGAGQSDTVDVSGRCGS
jgi:hypothetical protein